MSEEKKECYKVQSKTNRSEFDERRRVFIEQKKNQVDSEVPQLNVIEAVKQRREAKNSKLEASRLLGFQAHPCLKGARSTQNKD